MKLLVWSLHILSPLLLNMELRGIVFRWKTAFMQADGFSPHLLKT